MAEKNIVKPEEENKIDPLDNNGDVLPTPPEKPEAPKETKSKKESDTIEVSRETLAKIMDKLETLEKTNVDLIAIADKEKLNKVQLARAGGKLVKSVNISQINNLLVVGWAKVKDDVYFDEQGRLHEEQIITVYYEGGTDKEMEYRMFSRVRSPLKAEVISETKDEDGNINLKVRMSDGKELEIDQKFVN